MIEDCDLTCSHLRDLLILDGKDLVVNSSVVVVCGDASKPFVCACCPHEHTVCVGLDYLKNAFGSARDNNSTCAN